MIDSALSLNTAFEISLISLLFPAPSMIPHSSCQGLTALLCYIINIYSNSQVTFALSSIAQPEKLQEREQDPILVHSSATKPSVECGAQEFY